MLKIGNQPVTVKEKDEYLGDILHEGGLAKGVRATIDKRYGRIVSAIKEITAILEDYRINSLGGLSAGLEILELALIPSLLNNAETWIEIDSDAENKLENLQNLMFRALFAVPRSTPKPILRFDLGHVSKKEKIHIKKLTFLYHLKNLQSGSLASEIFDLQVNYNFPGLITECRNLLKLYNLPDIVNSSPDLTTK